jgi:type I restriction enzyme S subunit
MGIKPGFKQTEVGVIPEDWDVRPLSEIAQDGSPICYGIVQVGPFVENGIPVLAIKNLNCDYVSNIHQASVEVERLYVRSRVQPNDVVISVKGTTGRVGIVPNHFTGNISRDIARVRLREDVDPKYVFHMLQSGLSQNRLSSAAVGTTRMELSISILKDVCIPIPPTKTEQEAISVPLGLADALIESLERLIAKKRHLKQGVKQELLTGKMRLPDVIQKYFCGPSPTCEERNIVNEEEWGVLKTTAITWEYGWDWTKHKTLPRVFWNRPDQEVRAGDVIVTKAGPRHRVGVTCWVDFAPERIVVSGKMIALRPSPERAVPFMLSAAISARDTQEFLNQRTTGMAESQVNFENEALIQAPILLPRLDEQVAITAILTDMDDDITTLENKLTKARQLKTGMMQELLTGRIRLT